MKVCVLIPIYNHKATIENVVESMADLHLPCLVIDDGSDSGTRVALASLARRFPWIEVDHFPHNRGRGAALRHGYAAAAARGFSHTVQLDADGQHDTTDIPRFLDAARTAPHALILGHPIFDRGAPWSRLYGRRLSQLIVWAYTASYAVGDPLCGFRCFPLEPTLQLLRHHRLGDRMEFDVEILVRLVWGGVPVVNVPTRVRYFPDGLSHFRLVKDNALIAALYIRLFVELCGRRLGIAHSSQRSKP